ncbi:hypothetical protein CA13_42310 [Planctomycetes bacterium CA13]|uniref:Uncharacterized protein n=1 Tax=Novipirellula herctigrandis TaxID=2527986 RepID=A0A5C5Z694_9BACT|nr:hypothetical protein CA13_42310 [Planctomycetes bacterium CA13]
MHRKINAISRLSAGLVCLVLLPIAISLSGSAQSPSRSATYPSPQASSPYQQRLSPYLDLLRTDNSLLGPYHSFVRPRQQIRQNVSTQAIQLQRIERTIERPTSTTTSSGRLPTGRGGTFNNYLHFYQFNR